MTIRRRIQYCKVVITPGAVTRQPAYGTVCKTEFVKNLELERGSWFSLHYKDFPRTVSTMYGGPVNSFVHNDFLVLFRASPPQNPLRKYEFVQDTQRDSVMQDGRNYSVL